MSTTITEKRPAEFGKYRAFFWPVHNFELKKLLPMFIMFFFISFVYSALRNVKDALVVTAPGSGAEALIYLKVFWVLPIAIVFMILYAKLSNYLSKEKLFYATIAPFLAFFALFALVLYPAHSYLHPAELADKAQLFLPQGLSGLVATFRNWTFSLFYVFAELWGSFVLSLLFWGFANDITKVTEAKRFYALFGIGANLALYAAGDAVIFFNKLGTSAIGPEIDSYQFSLNCLMAASIVCGFFIIVIYKWINRNVLTDPKFYSPEEQSKTKKAKPKMSLGDSFKFLAKSRYMLGILILVLSYNIIINLIEMTWKNQAGLLYPIKTDYSNFMGMYQKILAVLTVLMMLFVSSNVLRRFGWRVAAMITPAVLLITGVGFFAFVIFKDQLSPIVTAMGTTTLVVAVIFGTIQNIMSKASKYSLFDPTKEMAYIPLDQESKVKGKAAIDTVGARLGKAGGSGIQFVLILLFGSIGAVTPYIAVIMLGILAAWMWAINDLNEREFKKIEKKEAAATA